MNKKNLQAKHISDLEVLQLLWPIRQQSLWVIEAALDLPHKVVLAKMANLIRRKMVSGCACGCRGDFTLTEAGRFLRIELEQEWAVLRAIANLRGRGGLPRASKVRDDCGLSWADFEAARDRLIGKRCVAVSIGAGLYLKKPEARLFPYQGAGWSRTYAKLNT